MLLIRRGIRVDEHVVAKTPYQVQLSRAHSGGPGLADRAPAFTAVWRTERSDMQKGVLDSRCRLIIGPERTVCLSLKFEASRAYYGSNPFSK